MNNKNVSFLIIAWLILVTIGLFVVDNRRNSQLKGQLEYQISKQNKDECNIDQYDCNVDSLEQMMFCYKK